MDSISKRLSAPGLRAFFRIAEAWNLSRDEQRAVLGGVSAQTLYDWSHRSAAARLDGDQLDRVSYVLGIYKTLHVLFDESERADGWITRENSATPFGGKRAVDLMCSGRMADLIDVRRYLDGVRYDCR